jgi:hypothetical protein
VGTYSNNYGIGNAATNILVINTSAITAYAPVQVGANNITTTGTVSTGNLTFTGTLNNISTTKFNYLYDLSGSVQAQINTANSNIASLQSSSSAYQPSITSTTAITCNSITAIANGSALGFLYSKSGSYTNEIFQFYTGN